MDTVSSGRILVTAPGTHCYRPLPSPETRLANRDGIDFEGATTRLREELAGSLGGEVCPIQGVSKTLSSSPTQAIDSASEFETCRMVEKHTLMTHGFSQQCKKTMCQVGWGDRCTKIRFWQHRDPPSLPRPRLPSGSRFACRLSNGAAGAELLAFEKRTELARARGEA